MQAWGIAFKPRISLTKWDANPSIAQLSAARIPVAGNP